MIQGGYILLARKTLESELFDKPPLFSKLWQWMLLRAEWRPEARLPRGSFITTIDDMREAMSWRVGFRKVTPTKDEIRAAYEWFARNRDEAPSKPTMITTMKTTRGMMITVNNYDVYQTPQNYEAHNEARNENAMKPETTPHDSKEVQEEKNKKKDNTPLTPRRGECSYSASFEEFWSAYPLRKGKASAYRAWKSVEKKHPGVKPPQIIAAVKAQVEADTFRSPHDNQLYIPHPATWLNAGRWDDDVKPPGQATDPTAGMTLAQKLEWARTQQ